MTQNRKTVWITGAARRVGRALALGLAKIGDNIVVHYNTSHEAAEETARDIHTLGSEAFLIQADLSCLDEIESAVTTVTSRWPVIDVLIHNAAVFFPTPFSETTEEDWDTTLDSNLKGPYFLTQALLSTLSQSPAPKLIFLGDDNIQTPAPRFIPYAISKEGLHTLAKGLHTALPKITTHFVALGPTLAPEDSTIQSPPLTHSLDDLVTKVIQLAHEHV